MQSDHSAYSRKVGTYLRVKNHMLIHNKARMDNIMLTCAILHNMLFEHDKWEDYDNNNDIAADSN